MHNKLMLQNLVLILIMEVLVTNNLNEYFLNVLLMNHFDRLIVNQDKLIMFDRNVVQLQIHVQK